MSGCRHRILYPLQLGPPFPNDARTLLGYIFFFYTKFYLSTTYLFSNTINKLLSFHKYFFPYYYVNHKCFMSYYLN